MIANHPHANKRPIAQGIASLGRGKDTMLVHMTPGEVQGLQKLAMAHGGSLTINPQTGLPEAGFLSAMLPMLIGGALSIASGGALTPAMAALMTGAGYTAATGSLKKGLMAGLGAYGGAGLGSGLAAAGEATTAATTQAADLNAINQAAAAEAQGVQAGLTKAGTEAGLTATQSQLPLANVAGPGEAQISRFGGIDVPAGERIISPDMFAKAPAPVEQISGINEFSSAANPQVTSVNAPTTLSNNELMADQFRANEIAQNKGQFDRIAYEQTAAPKVTPTTVASATPTSVPFEAVKSADLQLPAEPATTPPSSMSKAYSGLKSLGAESSVGRNAFLGAPESTTASGLTDKATGVGGLGGLAKYSLAAANPIIMEPGKVNAPGVTPTEYYNTSYSPGERNPRFGEAGQPYFINQGFTKGTTSKTANVAGGGLLAFNGTTGSYVPESSVSSRYNPYNDDPESEIIASRFKDSPKSPYAKQPSISASVKKLSAKQVAALADSPDEVGYSEAVAQDVLNRATDKYYTRKRSADLSAATGGAIRGYDEGGDVQKQQTYQSPFQIQQDRPDAAALNQYMSGLNKSLQGAPVQKYSAPSFTSQGVIPGEGNRENGEPFPDVPAFTFNPSRPIAPVAPVAQPAIQPVTQPSPGLPSIAKAVAPVTQPALPSWMAPLLPPDQAPATQPTTQPTAPSYFPGFDEFKSTYTPPPPPPKGEISAISDGEGISYFQDEAGEKFNRKLIGQSGDDRNYKYTPVNYTPPEEAYQKLIDERMANPPAQQPIYTPPTYTPPTQPTSQPSDGGMVTDQWGNTYYEPAPLINTGTIMTDAVPRSTDSDAPGIPIDQGIQAPILNDPYSTPMGGGLAEMVQPPPPPPPPAPEVPTYQSNQIYANENGNQVYRDEEGRERRVPDEHPSDRAGGPIKAKKYAMGGIATLQTYAAGGKLLNGDGDGMSDSIPAVINGPRPQRAALADGEFVIPADVVSHLGNGSTKAGAKRLYQMMDKVRMARVGTKKQGKQINPDKFMPA